jgi:ubiquinone/menaquinone biosynthesis C-methylase UbiE
LDRSQQWQLARAAAETYERIVVPTLTGPFAQTLIDWAQLMQGETVLDVGCGTGAAARAAAIRVGATGRVIGTDINPGMIALAQSMLSPVGAPILWKQLSVEDLRPDEVPIDVVLSAQAAQFFPNKPHAFAIMRSMLKPGGRMALSVWCSPEDNPYFHAYNDAVARHLGSAPAAELLAGFGLSNPDTLLSLLTGAGYSSPQVDVVVLNVPLPPLATFIPQHFLAMPIAETFLASSAAQQQALVTDIIAQLDSYKQSTTGNVIVPFRTYLAGGKRASV